MILEASMLVEFFDRNSAGHWGAVGQIELASGGEELIVSPFVIAELESIVRARFGRAGWLAVLDELAGGAWTIATVDAEHLRAVRELVATGATVANASVAVLTERDS